MATSKRLRQQGYGRRKAATQNPTVPNDPESLRARRAARQSLDLNDQLLLVNHPSKTKPFQRDFTSLSEDFPGVKHLTLQLLAGAKQKYGKVRPSYTTLQDLYIGIEEFLLSISADDLNVRSVEAIEDIDFQVAKNFDAWLLQKYPGRTLNRKRFGMVRGVVEHLQKKFPEAPRLGKHFTWPNGPRSTEEVTQGYSVAVFNALTKASLEDIKFVMTFMKGFQSIAESEDRILDRDPSIEELIREFGEREATLEAEGRLISTRPSKFESKIRKSLPVQNGILRWGMTMNDFIAEYRSRRDECLSLKKIVSRVKVNAGALISGCSASESYRMAMATMVNMFPNWPLDMQFRSANDLFSFEEIRLNPNPKRTAVEIKTYRILSRMKLGYQDKAIEVGLMAYFAQRFFTAETLYPFFLYVQMNTGWNEEVVTSLTDCLDDHIEPDIIDQDYVVIYGSKLRVNKAQGCRSSKSNPLSVYRVLRFIESVLSKHRSSINYIPGTLWQFILTKNLWVKFEKVVKNIDNRNIREISKSFLKRHNIIVDAEKNVQRIESRRVRTTYETRRRESGLSLEEVSPLLGHKEIATTDINYDSDEGSTNLKNKRIRDLQQSLLDDFRYYGARIISSTTLSELREAIGKDDATSKDDPEIRAAAATLGVTPEQTIHLLSPKGQTYISVCIDRREPTWVDARLFVPIGDECNFFNRCCLCDKSLIFKEALPYIARRVSDIQQLRFRIPAEEWAANYSEEGAAWQQILDDWTPTEEVNLAKVASSSRDFCLPLTMRGA